MLVLAYAIHLGVEVDYKTYYRQEPSWGHTAELSFCILFACDLFIRMALAQGQFITGTGRWWNLLDSITVFLFVAKFLVENELLETSSSAFRIVRMFRVFRIIWAVRASLAHSSQLRQFRILLESLSESMNLAPCWERFIVLWKLVSPMSGKDLLSQSQALNPNLLADGLTEECSSLAPDPDFRQCIHLQSGFHGRQLVLVPQSADRARVPQVWISEELYHDPSPDTIQWLFVGLPGRSSVSVVPRFCGSRCFLQRPRAHFPGYVRGRGVSG